MTRMLSLSMLSTGGALFALVGYMQYDPLAFTTPTMVEREAAPTRSVAEKAPESVIEPASPEVMEMPAVVIVSRWSEKPRGMSIEPAVAPCSPWRELGFTYVEHGEALGTQRVRQLCAMDVTHSK
jgi:hypothetical protein